MKIIKVTENPHVTQKTTLQEKLEALAELAEKEALTENNDVATPTQENENYWWNNY